MLQVHSAIVRVLDQELEGEHGLPLTSYEVLLHLSESEGKSLRMGDLAERMLLSRSGLTRLVDRLAGAGLVEREDCVSDLRGSFARLTAEGERRFAEARPTHLDGIRKHFLDHLSSTDRESLARAWGKVLPQDT